MLRASRIYAPGRVFHITHRCHKKEFLLKFKQDRERYRYWLYEAKKRYGICILNYMITSNHIHLLVKCTAEDIIPCFIYIDLNMVRAGRVKDPLEWEHCGYYELFYGGQRFGTCL